MKKILSMLIVLTMVINTLAFAGFAVGYTPGGSGSSHPGHMGGTPALSYEFETDGDADGLTFNSGISAATVAGHKLIGDAVSNGRIISDGISVDTDIYTELTIGMAYMNLGNDSQATYPSLFLKGDDVASEKIDADQLLTAITSSDTEVFTFDIAGNGEIDGFEFMPFAGEGTFYIDYIRFSDPQEQDEHVVLTFSPNGASKGIAPYSISVEPGDTIVLPQSTNLEKVEHNFNGWSLDPNGDFTTAVADYTLSTNTTLYAIWSPKAAGGVIAAYYPASGSSVYRIGTTISVKFNTAMNPNTLIPGNFSEEYISKVTYSAPTNTATLYLNNEAELYGETISFTPENIYSENADLYVAEEYTLSFKPYVEDASENFIINGDFEQTDEIGVYVEDAVGEIVDGGDNRAYRITANSGEPAKLIANIGLLPGKIYSVKFSAKTISGNSTVKGTVTANQGVVATGENLAINSDDWAEYSAIVSLPDSAAAPYSLCVGIESDEEWMIDNLFIAEAAIINFESDFGVTGQAPDALTEVYAIGQEVTMPENTTYSKQGYDFAGWTADGGVTVYEAGETYTVSKAVVFKPVFTTDSLEHSIVFDYGMDGFETIMYIAARGSDVCVPENPSKTGYKFLGWEDENGNAPSAVEGNVTYYAIWSENNSWDFDTDENFEGWDVPAEDFSDAVVADGYLSGHTEYRRVSIINNDVAVDSGRYGKIEVKLSSDFSSDGAAAWMRFENSNGDKDTIKVSEGLQSGDNTVVFDMTLSDKWSDTITALIFYPNIVTDADFSIDYIKLVEADPTIVYNANTGYSVTGMPENITGISVGEVVNLSTDIPQRNNGVFLGWSLDQYGATGYITKVTASAGVLHVYAIWQYEDKHEWHFNMDDDDEGWQADEASISGAVVADGVYTLDCDKISSNKRYEPFIQLNGLNFKASEYDSVIVRARYINCDLVDSNTRLYFGSKEQATDSEVSDGFVPGKSIQTDGKFAEYYFNMTLVSEWKNTITYLRFDPFVQALLSSDGYPHKVEIDYIKLVPNTEKAENVRLIIEEPKTLKAPKVATIQNQSCMSVTTKWAGEFTEEGLFKPEAVYSATMLVKPYSGLKYDGSQSVYVNGNKINDYIINDDGNVVVNVTFPATERRPVFTMHLRSSNLKDGMVRIEKDLGSAVITPVFEGELVPDKSVTWSINTELYGNITEGGRFNAKNNGYVLVKATSVYDPSVYATITVAITNQDTPYVLTYDANVGSGVEVTNLPEANTMARGITKLSSQGPSVNARVFDGWSEYPNGPKITELNVIKDTTVYARWTVPDVAYEFNGADAEGWEFNGCVANSGVADGSLVGSSVYYYPNPPSTAGGYVNPRIQLLENVALDADDLSVMKMCMKHSNVTASEDVNMRLYFNGYGQPLKSVEFVRGSDSDGFVEYTFKLTDHSQWSGEVTQLVIEPFYATGEFEIDYIRFFSRNKKLTYHANAGEDTVTGMPENDKYLAGETITLSDEIPQRTGYVFKGWTTNPIENQAITTVTMSNDTTVFAIWELDWDIEWTDRDGAPITADESGEYTVTNTMASEDLTDKGIDGSEFNLIRFTMRQENINGDEPAYGTIQYTTENGTFSTEFEVFGNSKNNRNYSIDMSYVSDWYNAQTISQVTIVPYNGEGTSYISDFAIVAGGKGNGKGEAPKTSNKQSYIRYVRSGMIIVDSLPGFYKSDIGTNEKGWDFNTTGNAEGWNVNSIKNSKVSGGNYYGEAVNSDPLLSGPDMNVSASQYRYVVIRMRYNLEGDSSTSQLFFITDKQGLSEAASVKAPLKFKYSNNYVDIVFDMASNPLWTGTVKKMRFDPFASLGAFSIQYIKLCETLPENLLPDNKQGTPMETTEPEKDVEYTDITEWVFSNAKDSTGWTLEGTKTGKTIKNGAIVGSAQMRTNGTYDPILYSPALNYNADKYTILKVGMKHINATPGMSVNMFFTKPGEPWSASMCVPAEQKISGTSSDGVVEYTFKLQKCGKWYGTVTQFRLDPFDSAGDFEISYVRFLEKEELKMGEELLTNGDAEDVYDIAFDSDNSDIEISITADPTDSSNHVFSSKCIGPAAQYCYFRQQVRFVPGAKYIFEFDVYVDSLMDGSTDFTTNVVGNMRYREENTSDHAKAIGEAQIGKWTHLMYEFTVSSSSTERDVDQCTIYFNPVNGMGINYYIDNLTLKQILE